MANDFGIADFGPRGRGNFTPPDRSDRGRRFATQGMGPEDVQLPPVARDPGVRAQPLTVDDPTGRALSAFSRDMAAVGTAFNTLYQQRQAA